MDIPGQVRDLTGKRFQRLTVVRLAHCKRAAFWECRCDCGNSITVSSGSLVSGHTKSCGCLKRDKCRNRWTTHGNSKRREFNIWYGMNQRCSNPKSIGFTRYGAAGITVCERWRNSFEAFIADMGDCPAGYTLERIENDRGYSPDNCRWATRREQARNRSTNRLITYRGETAPQAVFCERAGIGDTTFSERLKRGWAIDRALETPVRRRVAS